MSDPCRSNSNKLTVVLVSVSINMDSRPSPFLSPSEKAKSYQKSLLNPTRAYDFLDLTYVFEISSGQKLRLFPIKIPSARKKEVVIFLTNFQFSGLSLYLPLVPEHCEGSGVPSLEL